jgi:hypothetical protein
MVSLRRAGSFVSRDAPRKLHAVSAEEDAFAIFGKALIQLLFRVIQVFGVVPDRDHLEN